MDLYLVRHAVAVPKDPKQWPDDARRPLTPEGERGFRKDARGVRRLVPSVDVVMASPFLRAWRTAELLQEEAGWPPPVPTDALATGRTPAEAMTAIRSHLEVNTLALVGHEPNLTELTSTLMATGSTKLRIHLAKGGALALRLRPPAERDQATLRWLVTPQVLRGLAR